ncbi:MAG: PorV/PorQ family protein [Ignavibacteriae bacterium]|nr:MAG: PorV/PorQ family protein [Ignavibacteriota bacterium]
MKTNRILVLLLAAISLVTASAFSQEKAGTTSMQFLKVMPCARATALGDAYSAVASGAEAIYWNPAGLAWSEDQEISLSYINWIFDAKLYDLAFGLPVANLGSFGLQLQYVDYGSFDEAIRTGATFYPGQSGAYLTGRTFKPYDYVVGMTFARKLTDKFSFGVSVKYAYESLYDQGHVTSFEIGQDQQVGNSYDVTTNTSVMLFDAGFRYNTGFHTIQLGASAQNFGPDIKYTSSGKETKYPAPLAFRLGATADLLGPNSLFGDQQGSRLGLMFDLFLANDAEQQEHLGLEYEFASTVALRAGYKMNYGTEGLTFGGGVHQSMGRLKFSIDYSYGVMDAIINAYTGNTHRISVGVGIQ